jgi:hypothetical protein
VTTRVFGGSLPEARSISVTDAERPSNQLSNDRSRRRRTPADERGPRTADQGKMRKHKRQIAFPDTEAITSELDYFTRPKRGRTTTY